jgi:hypothetical protein
LVTVTVTVTNVLAPGASGGVKLMMSGETVVHPVVGTRYKY